MSWQERSKIWVCGMLIKIGRLTHDDFSRDELNALIQPHFPRLFHIDVPAGAGSVHVTEARVQFNAQQQRLALECFAELELNVLDAKNQKPRYPVCLLTPKAHRITAILVPQ